MSRLADYDARFAAIEGWFNRESQAIWDCILSFQDESNIRGHMMEIGVWRGKSAALSLLFAREDEQCVFVDPGLTDEVMDTLKRAGRGRCVFVKAFSASLSAHGFLADRCQLFRWVHIDGEHSGMAIHNDLSVADVLVHRHGLVCLDDFFNPAYPQITQAVFRYLDAHPGSFSLVLCGFNKGYLCRPIFAPVFRNFLYCNLVDRLAELRGREFTLWRSTVPDDSTAFGVMLREQGGKPYRGPDWAQEQVIV